MPARIYTPEEARRKQIERSAKNVEKRSKENPEHYKELKKKWDHITYLRRKEKKRFYIIFKIIIIIIMN
jgi:hypothetical protein